MKEQDILFGLAEVPGLGWHSVHKLVQADALSYFQHSDNPAGLLEIGIESKIVDLLIRSFRLEAIETRKKQYEQKAISIITFFDGHYPELLKHTAQPPWVLYAAGSLRQLERPAVAMVGTRAPTIYGRKIARRLSQQLSERGICVVSGMARGIDSEAHHGALKAAGGTIAVLGSGIDVIYPPENAALYKQIRENGLVLSEFPSGTPAKPGLFPRRNRIIAGLGLGTVVIEAAERSGSLITADFALEESRDVFAVPGQMYAPKSQGPLQLIKQGAKIVTDVVDIVEEYEHRINMEKSDRQDKLPMPINTNRDEARILELLSQEPQSFGRLLRLSQFEFGHLHAVLLSLILKKQIEQYPGSIYAITF